MIILYFLQLLSQEIDMKKILPLDAEDIFDVSTVLITSLLLFGMTCTIISNYFYEHLGP